MNEQELREAYIRLENKANKEIGDLIAENRELDFKYDEVSKKLRAVNNDDVFKQAAMEAAIEGQSIICVGHAGGKLTFQLVGLHKIMKDVVINDKPQTVAWAFPEGTAIVKIEKAKPGLNGNGIGKVE